jgi:hypothetical protein
MKKMAKVAGILAGFVGVSAWAGPTPSPHSSYFTATDTSQPATTLGQLSRKLRSRMFQLQVDVKAGKLTKAQAEKLHDKLVVLRQQELGYLKTNPANPSKKGRYLTAGQIIQLDGQLTTLSGDIPAQ